MKYFWALSLIICLLVGCGAKNFNSVAKCSKHEFKIGYFGPLTGPVVSTGEPIVNAFRLANMNNQKVGDTLIKVLYEDDKCNSQQAVTTAQKLINIDQVDLLVSGVCSASTLAVAPLAEEKKIILISPLAASPDITLAGDYVFRLSTSSNKAAMATAGYISNMGFKNIAVVYENNDYPIGWKDALDRELNNSELGIAIFSEKVEIGQKDFRTTLLKLAGNSPDLMLFIFLTPVGANNILSQYKELGLSFSVLGNELFSQDEIISNPDSNNVLTSIYDYDLYSGAIQNLKDEYFDKYGKKMPNEIHGALAYDTYSVLLHAIEQCDQFSSDCVKQELYKIKNFVGISGNITIDENGDTERRFVIKKIQNGRLVDP